MATLFIPDYIKQHAVNAKSIDAPLRDWFDRYFLAHETGFSLAERVTQGEIKHDGIWYKINWLDFPVACYTSNNVVLSFRRIRGYKFGYVLISIGDKK